MSHPLRTPSSLCLGGVRLGLLLSVWLVSGCAVDTELGLEAEITRSTLEVSGGQATVQLDVDYRVGTYAEGERGFQPQAIELYRGDTLIAQLVPRAVGEIRPRLAPGESASGTLEGSGPASGDVCGQDVTVLLRWLDTTANAIGAAEATVDSVVCP